MKCTECNQKLELTKEETTPINVIKTLEHVRLARSQTSQTYVCVDCDITYEVVISKIMKNKKPMNYYTPSIEEFHVGFEYEIKDWWTNKGSEGWDSTATKEEIETIKETWKESDGFIKRKLNVDMLHDWSHVGKKVEVPGVDYRHEWERITTGIKDGTVRVKYLDNKDFMDLGFHVTSVPTTYDKRITINGEEFKIRVITLLEKNKYLIRRMHGIRDTVLFEGEIKNKSELCSILNKIGGC